jgi:hypothetical protein
MTTSSRTWFYNEPEHRPYYLEERVNQTLWAARFGTIYLDCVQAEPPFKMIGSWHTTQVTIDWVPKDWFSLTTDQAAIELIKGFAQVLQMQPTLSYVNENGLHIAEWRRKDATARLNEIEGHAQYTNLKTYKK